MLSISFQPLRDRRVPYRRGRAACRGQPSYDWEAKKIELRRGTSLSAKAVNLPHHGSKYDCSSDVLDQLFAPDGKRFAISSGSGISHLLHKSHSSVWSERLEAFAIARYRTVARTMGPGGGDQFEDIAAMSGRPCQFAFLGRRQVGLRQNKRTLVRSEEILIDSSPPRDQLNTRTRLASTPRLKPWAAEESRTDARKLLAAWQRPWEGLN
jgi:hypothetical protein